MRRLTFLVFVVLALLSASGATPLRAQDAVTAPKPDAAAETEAEESEEPAVQLSAADVSAVQRRFQYALRLILRGVYDDNIFLRRDNIVDDFYFTVEPGITLGFGDIVGSHQNNIRLDYAPTALFYLEHADANALQHIIRLSANYHFRRLAVSFSQDIQLLEGTNLSNIGSSGPNPVPGVNLDVGGVGQNIFTTNAGFAYDLTGKIFMSGGMQYIVYDYDGNLLSSATLSGNLFLNFTYSPKLTIGLGGTAGYNWVDDPSPDQHYEQVNARVSYQATGKVSANASFGIEFRHFGGGSARSDAYISPVYDLGLSYQPFDGTSISVSGSRRTQNSAVAAGQDYANTNLNFSVRQRFFRRFYLGLAVGYQNSTYFSTVEGVETNREDNYYFVQPAIDATITRYWTAGVYYLHRRNDSSAFDFKNNQVGLRTSLTF